MATAPHITFSSSASLYTERFFSSSLPSSSVSFPYPTFSCSHSFSISHAYDSSKSRVFSVSAVVEEEPLSAPPPPNISVEQEHEEEKESKSQVRACQLYVCNLPRTCDDSELLEMFKPYGTVQSVEISRSVETGISRGCGYITMSSIDEAIAAVTALDASDVCGREMRVRFSADMNRKKNIEILNSMRNKNLIFETPHKIYVGNLAWSVKPELVREYFTQFGTVVSVRVLYDRKAGKNRVYGFVSFSSAEELKGAISSDGTELLGRKMLVRKALKSSEPE